VKQSRVLAPHRIAFRAVIRSVCGGVGAGLFLFLFIEIWKGLRGSEVVQFLAVPTVCAALWCGLLVVSVEVGQYFESRVRYAVPLAVGIFVLLVVAGGGLWVVALLEGRDMVWAVERMIEVPQAMWEEPEHSVNALILLLAPFGTLSTVQLLARGRGVPSWRLLEVGAVAAAGLASILLVSLARQKWYPDTTAMMVACAGAPALATFGMQLGARLERALLGWWERRLRDDLSNCSTRGASRR
jgi:hypothetical protein